MKTHSKILLSLLPLLLAAHSLWAQPQYSQFQPIEVEAPSCLHSDEGQDSLQFPGGHGLFDTFYSQLDTLLQYGRGHVNILHIGGSHVQAGFFSHRVRTRLAAISPSAVGGRGLIFPFRALKTNAPQNYQIEVKGMWTGERCLSQNLKTELGLSGASVTTRDTSASLTLPLQHLAPFAHTTLRILGEGATSSIVPVLICDGDTLQALPSDGKPGYCFPLMGDTCHIGFRGILQDSLGFTLRGILPGGHVSGITYTEAGINGAAVPSWLRCSLFQTDLSLLPPSLVIFGIGINDANVLPQNFKPEEFKANYRSLIHRIRQVNPSCCFIFVTNNDCWLNVRGRRRQYNPSTPLVQQAMRELAREFDGALFDVYAMMGGARSSNAWVRAGLQRTDHIHFTREGYELWGDLLYNALAYDYLKHIQP